MVRNSITKKRPNKNEQPKQLLKNYGREITLALALALGVGVT